MQAEEREREKWEKKTWKTIEQDKKKTKNKYIKIAIGITRNCSNDDLHFYSLHFTKGI